MYAPGWLLDMGEHGVWRVICTKDKGRYCEHLVLKNNDFPGGLEYWEEHPRAKGKYLEKDGGERDVQFRFIVEATPPADETQ